MKQNSNNKLKVILGITLILIMLYMFNFQMVSIMKLITYIAT